MNLDNVYICDIETIGMLDEIESFDDLHVLSCTFFSGGEWKTKSTNKKEDIQRIVGDLNNTLVFHNGICYDKPVLQKMGFEFNAKIIDTLGLSYYLYPERDKHGLEAWGEFFGVQKPMVGKEEWEGIGKEKENIINYYESEVNNG